MPQDLESFFIKIKRKLLKAIQKGNLDVKEIRNLIASKNFNLYGQFQNYLDKYLISKDILTFFAPVYKEIAHFLKNLDKKDGNIFQKDAQFFSHYDLVEEIFNDILLQKYCAECHSKRITSGRYAFNENKIIFFCGNCQKNVKSIYDTDLMALFLVYIYQWATFESIDEGKLEIKGSSYYLGNFLKFLFINGFKFFKLQTHLDKILLFYDVLNNIGINFKNFEESCEDINTLILKQIKNSLERGEYSRIKNSIEHLIKIDPSSEISPIIQNPKFKRTIEKFFYIELSKNLETKNFENFENLISNSDKLDIFIDIQKISNRYSSLKKCIIESIENVSMGYQTSSLGDIIDLIDFYNKYNLLAKNHTEQERSEINSLKKNSLLIANLKDLFINISDSLLIYIKNYLPNILFEFFIKNKNTLFYSDIEQLIYYIKNQFFNSYTIYGLSVRNLGSTLEFIKSFKEEFYKKENLLKFQSNNDIFFEFVTKYTYPIHFYGGSSESRDQIASKKHLISPQNIQENIKDILSNDNYSFLNLSMVLIGGIGPQGHGFTYSTPKGEVIEICSDRKENEAIIIKFKEFLKNQFINKLEQDLLEQNINLDIIINIIKNLDDTLKKKELINYSKKDVIFDQIKKKLDVFLEHNSDDKIKKKIFKKIKESIDLILRPISMEDQFKTRMKLISNGKIKPEDVAKLTSLKGKSHYDVLRERFFYQYIINWFYEIYIENKG